MTANASSLIVLRYVLLTATCFTLVAGCDSEAPDDTTAGELLFDLTPEQVEAIHAAYLAHEDLADTEAKLTAPFDCSLYGDFCEQVGREAAIDITARQVDLALDGVSPEQLETQSREWIAEAEALPRSEEGEEFRSNGDWAVRTKDDWRLRVRNGISSPLFAMREAWTESQLQHRDVLGIWSQHQATQICANTGVNEQVRTGGGGGGPTTEVTIESFDPANNCTQSDGSHKWKSFHERNTGDEVGGMWSVFTITARGCGTADINDTHLGICADSHSEAY